MTENTYLKMLCRLNPEFFITDCLGYSVEQHHSDMLNHITTNKTSLNLSPRGFGKSTIATIALSLYKIVNNPNIRILIVSSTASQAQSFLREIKSHLESNKKLIEIFGTFQQSAKWSETEITVNRTSISKESTITIAGANGSMTGRHFDLILVDDVTDFESSRTQIQREKLSSWFKTTLVPSLEPHGEMHVLGTRYHPQDIYEEMMSSGLYATQIQRAIQEDNTSLWPKKFPIELLEQKKSELGSLIFSLQYMNDISLVRAGNIFRYEWLQWYSADELPSKLKVFMGVDLAIGEKDSNDYFVIATIGIDDNNKIYVLDMYRSRLSFDKQMEMIRQKAQEWSPLRIGIESNSYQKSISQELIRTTNLPIKMLVSVKDKTSRMMKRSAEFENGRVYLKKDMHLFVDELVLFGAGSQHDDMVDSYDFARQVSETASTAPIFPTFVKCIGASGTAISGNRGHRPFSIMKQP